MSVDLPVLVQEQVAAEDQILRDLWACEDIDPWLLGCDEDVREESKEIARMKMGNPN
jgi:hypothetical protein